MRVASSMSAAARSAGIDRPLWARTAWMNTRSGSQVTGSARSGRLATAVRILAARVLPGPTPVTSTSRSASCSRAPRTVTRKEPDNVAPASSVAVHSTVVVPIANVVPEAGVHETVAPVSSVAVASKVTGAPAGDVASTVRSPGTCRTGGVSTRSL